ncbi:pyrimidine reductase family protein [Mycobacterium sp. SMC-4]|uniref:pyrimidine reductase family protein n=1 Tax=Mycobacterium sp. SMC-4 TaxID=2857059 RepID=UPI0021B43385|nr:pyrimidine reductase family protein [Mycobacterium sp. SMC-4]UXA18046.1 pyrimidine reductase family protein [Mycobacterium sp. SMC-4]
MSVPRLGSVADLTELIGFYSTPPSGVRANMIFSADGAAAFAGRAGPLSDPLDQSLLRALRGFADVILVGAGTARAERYGPVRLHAVAGPVPPLAVVSRTGELPESMFADPTQRHILVTTERSAQEHNLAPDDRRDVLIAGTDTVDVTSLITQFGQRGLNRILCEGGPTLLDVLTGADLVDELCVTVSPTLAGVQDVGTGSAALQAPRTMALDHVLTHADYLYLKYSRRSPVVR